MKSFRNHAVQTLNSARIATKLAFAALASIVFTTTLLPKAQAETPEAEALKTLQAKLSDEQIDQMMAAASNSQLPYARFSQPVAQPNLSQCRVTVSGVDPSLATNPQAASHLARLTRQYCLGFMNFQLDTRFANKPAVARDNFICTVAAIDEGTPDTYTTHKEGFEGVIVQKKLFRSPKVTEIDNTRIVEDRHAGRPSSIAMLCLVNTTGVQNGESLATEREAWKSAQIQSLSAVVAAQRAAVESEARSKSAARDNVDQELSRLTKTFLRLDTQIASYNRCLEGYESFARMIRRKKIENESDTKECPILVAALKQKVNEITTAAKSATTSTQQNGNAAELKKVGLTEESVCARQITYCEAHRPK